MRFLIVLVPLVAGCVPDLQDSRFRGPAPSDPTIPAADLCKWWTCDRVHPWVLIRTDENRECRAACGVEE